MARDSLVMLGADMEHRLLLACIRMYAPHRFQARSTNEVSRKKYQTLLSAVTPRTQENQHTIITKIEYIISPRIQKDMSSIWGHTLA